MPRLYAFWWGGRYAHAPIPPHDSCAARLLAGRIEVFVGLLRPVKPAFGTTAYRTTLSRPRD
jgi:hypothetical protein